LAWAVLVRPFGAHFGISSARSPGVQQKMWDMLSPWGEGYVSDLGTPAVQPRIWDTLRRDEGSVDVNSLLDSLGDRGGSPRRRVRLATLRRFLRHFVGPTPWEAAEQKTADLEAVERRAQILDRCGARLR